MTDHGRYGDDDRVAYALPDEWARTADEVLATALAQTLAAITGQSAANRLARYYDRNRAYAGTMFLDVEPNDPFVVGPSDLYAVTTLSMELDVRQGRLLLDQGAAREGVRRELRGIDPALPITDLEHGQGGSAETLRRMYELHRCLRTLLSDESKRWVFAAKLSARKRPRLFPVRDNLVCSYLAGGRTLKSGDGWPGDFSVDIQVYAYLATHPKVSAAISWLRADLTYDRRLRIDDEDLRVLDSALWMKANDAARA